MKHSLLSLLACFLFPALAAGQDVLPPPLPPAATAPVQVPRSKEEVALSFAPVIRRAGPAVVNIYTRKSVRERLVHPLMRDPFFREFFSDQLPEGVTRQRMQSSLGSGVIVRADGLVVTNNHVVKEADQIIVVLSDRREFEAGLVTGDARSDLAVLKLKTKGESFPTLPLKDSDEVNVGDLVLAIGNPFGVGQTVTMGIVSAVARSADIGNTDVNYFIQTDAAINPGNSGGALVSVDGQLIGVPSAIYSRDGGSLGIGFATPSNLVRAVLESSSQGGRVVRGWLGFEGETLTAELAQSLGIARPSGVIVKSIHPASPLRTAGVQRGDIIAAVNNHDVPDTQALQFRIATTIVGSAVTLKILRAGQPRSVTVSLIAPPESPSRQETLLKDEQPLAGAKVVNLSPAVAHENNLDDAVAGVLVIGVASGTPAAALGLQRGDRIMAVNGKETTSVAALQEMLAASPLGWRLNIRRGADLFTLAVRP